jgi:hypothetical protein
MQDNITGWFTTDEGNHIPIHGGQSKIQAMKQFRESHDSTPSKLNNRQSVVDFVKKQVNVDLSKAEYKSNHPRSWMGVDFSKLSQGDKLRVQNALHQYGHNVQVVDNGGLGSAIYFER